MEAPTIPLETAAELSGIHPTSSSSSEIRVTRVPNEDIEKTFARTTNLASSALNARVLSRSNDFFAAAENLLTPTAPVHKPGVFVHTGAWYDGWETRRHNPAPYDWVVIKLGVSSGSIEGVEIDTAYFVGNYGEKAELQGTNSNEGGVGFSDDEIASPDFKNWKTILPIVECGPSQRRAWKIERIQNAATAAPAPTYTHVRLLMYPDGGFARLRLYGHAIPSSPAIDSSTTATERKGEEEEEKEEELSSALVGGLCLSASDQHYTPASNVILPGRGKDMGDGWETARSRTPGHVDWAIFRLGLVGTVHKIVVDTKDFRGNYPREVRVHGINLSKATTTTTTTTTTHGKDEELHLTNDHPSWIELLSGTKKTEADTEHVYKGADLAAGPNDERVFTHVKLTLIPDGGVKRFRIFGKRAM